MTDQSCGPLSFVLCARPAHLPGRPPPTTQAVHPDALNCCRARVFAHVGWVVHLSELRSASQLMEVLVDGGAMDFQGERARLAARS